MKTNIHFNLDRTNRTVPPIDANIPGKPICQLTGTKHLRQLLSQTNYSKTKAFIISGPANRSNNLEGLKFKLEIWA